jgi:hypothetical protein
MFVDCERRLLICMQKKTENKIHDSRKADKKSAAGARLEIRQVHQAEDFDEAFAPELKEQEERVAAQMAANANRYPGEEFR